MVAVFVILTILITFGIMLEKYINNTYLKIYKETNELLEVRINDFDIKSLSNKEIINLIKGNMNAIKFSLNGENNRPYTEHELLKTAVILLVLMNLSINEDQATQDNVFRGTLFKLKILGIRGFLEHFYSTLDRYKRLDINKYP